MTDDSQSSIRVLIVDDNRLTVENVARMLSFESDIEVVGSANGGRKGVRMAEALRPDVVLMDINMPEMDGIEACGLITELSPPSRVMMMSVQADLQYIKQAMAAGAREFLVKPFGFDELVNGIRQVHEVEPSLAEVAARMATMAPAAPERSEFEEVAERAVAVAVFGPKGGVGCSTVAANLALALQSRRKADVLLVDGDLVFGDLDALLDLRPSHRVLDVIEMHDPQDLGMLRQMMAEHSSGVRLMAAPSRPELSELVRPDAFLRLLRDLRGMYDFLVIDAGCRFDGLTQQVTELVDRVILVLTPELTAVNSVYSLLMMSHMRSFPPGKIILVMNKYSRAWGISPAAVGDTIGRPVVMAVPADNAVALDAANRGEPVLLSAPRSEIAKHLAALERVVPDGDQLAANLEEMAQRAQEELEAHKQAELAALLAEDVTADVTAPEAAPDERRGCARWFPGLVGRG